MASYHPLSRLESDLATEESLRKAYRQAESYEQANGMVEMMDWLRRQIELCKRYTDESILWEKEGGLHEDGRVKGNEVEAKLAVQREEARLKRKRIVERQRRASIRARSSARAEALETTSPDGAQGRSDTGLYS